MDNVSRAFGESDLLTIGELAERTGVGQATLRVWETRHGFPQPERLPSGHRRYHAADVARVLDVVRRREAGLRLETAIAEAFAAAEPGPASIYAELRRRHPGLAHQRLRKGTLLALSWAIEDEFCAKADRARIFGAFQRTQYFEHARPRWTELARVARSAVALADFEGCRSEQGVLEVPLAADSPLRREWAVVCDSRDLPVALTAWELPGQVGVRDRDRVFESIWTVDPRAVRDAARACALAVAEADPAQGAPLLHALADDPGPGVADLAAVSALYSRVLTYVDRYGR